MSSAYATQLDAGLPVQPNEESVFVLLHEIKYHLPSIICRWESPGECLPVTGVLLCPGDSKRFDERRRGEQVRPEGPGSISECIELGGECSMHVVEILTGNGYFG